MVNGSAADVLVSGVAQQQILQLPLLLWTGLVLVALEVQMQVTVVQLFLPLNFPLTRLATILSELPALTLQPSLQTQTEKSKCLRRATE